MESIKTFLADIAELPLMERRDFDLRLKQHGLPKGVDQLVGILESANADRIQAPRKDTLAPPTGQASLRPTNGPRAPEPEPVAVTAPPELEQQAG